MIAIKIIKRDNKVGMSKHTNKYYQLIKILRAEKQMITMRKTIRQQRNKMKLDKANTKVDQRVIAETIDQDNSLELDRQDLKITDEESKLVLLQQQYSRLWLEFKAKSLTLNQNNDILPIQKKINQTKDQAVIERMLEQVDSSTKVHEEKVRHLSNMLSYLWQELTEQKRIVDEHQLQIHESDKQLAKLKTDFDNEQKKIHERSNRFREQKSKDMMIKNINRQDNQMRNAMMSRIKLNQELDFSFQLQRRKAFNQSKSAILQKKKNAQEQLNKAKQIYQNQTKKSQELQQQKAQAKEQNKVLKHETVYFLKHIIKHFSMHSKGIKWILERLSDMKVTLTKSEFPQNLSNRDKEFLEELFTDNFTPKRERFNKTCFKVNGENKVINFSIQKSRSKMASMKTEPNLVNLNEFESFMNRNPSPLKRLQKKTTVYFDADNCSEGWFKDDETETQTNKFNVQINSLKKIYENTGKVIADKIKSKQWNYQSCKLMTAENFPEKDINSQEDYSIIEKLKLKFMSVRQNERRNQLRTFIFGSKDHQ